MEAGNDHITTITIIVSLIALFFSGLTALWTVWWQNKIRLGVNFIKTAGDFYQFEVTNRGSLPITVSKMAMSLNESTQDPILAFKAHPKYPDLKESLPFSLEPRTSELVFFDSIVSEDAMALIEDGPGEARRFFVFTETACGHFHRQRCEYRSKNIDEDPSVWDPRHRKCSVFRWMKR